MAFKFDPDKDWWTFFGIEDKAGDAAYLNFKLDALRKAFPLHADKDLIEAAVWSDGMTPKEVVGRRKHYFEFSMAPSNRKKYLKGIKPSERAAL